MLHVLLSNGYTVIPFIDYLKSELKENKLAIIRHDVDKSPHNSYKTAKLENEMGVNTSYYFRIVRSSYDKRIISSISELGHEIGYHYEDLAITKGDVKKAIGLFDKNLNKFREICEIKTICMHGSPLSKYDNRALWENFDYRDNGVVGEPYFDVDYDQFAYFTDTGRSWLDNGYVIRDNVNETNSNYKIKTTHKLIQSINKDQLPAKLFITTHPQRWTDNNFKWMIEFISQNLKNVLKKHLIKRIYVNR